MQASTSFTPAGRLEALEIHSADYTVDFYRLGNLMESKWFTDYFCGKLKGKTTGTFCGGLLLCLRGLAGVSRSCDSLALTLSVPLFYARLFLTRFGKNGAHGYSRSQRKFVHPGPDAYF